jgi:hypothetical protein
MRHEKAGAGPIAIILVGLFLLLLVGLLLYLAWRGSNSKPLRQNALWLGESTLQLKVFRPASYVTYPEGGCMKTRLLLCATVIALCTSWAFAQDSSSQSNSKSDVRTITGCLSKGDNANEFLLTADDGSTWEVRSSRVTLAGHVGHTIAATGVVSNAKAHNLKEDAKQGATDAGVTKQHAEHGHMKITDVKMVSDSCQK